MRTKKLYWFKIALQVKGSVIPAIYQRVLLCGSFGVFISILHYFKLPVFRPNIETVIPSITLGLLLVFRTNTAYERFCEGRKYWGSLVNDVRNLSHQIWVAIVELEPQDRKHKIVALRLLVAFAVVTKLHLRGEPISNDLEKLIPPGWCLKLKVVNNSPLEVAFWIADYLQQQYERDCLNAYQLTAMQNVVSRMVDNLGGCERILKTPIPLAYAIHLKQLLLIYCLLLPFQLVANVDWWTGAVVALISFTVFGIEQIAIEIENPFGHNVNHLPLDAICNTMLRNIESTLR